MLVLHYSIAAREILEIVLADGLADVVSSNTLRDLRTTLRVSFGALSNFEWQSGGSIQMGVKL